MFLNLNKIKSIGIVMALAFIFMLSVGCEASPNKKNNTVNLGETLQVYELEGIYDFYFEVLSVEKNYLIDEVIHSGECLAMKVKIKNNSAEELAIDPYLMKFNLLDESNNEISSLNIAWSSTMTNAIENIPSGQEKTGYFYFFDIDDNGETSNIKNNDVAKLEVEVIKYLERENGIISGDYEQYYVNLK